MWIAVEDAVQTGDGLLTAVLTLGGVVFTGLLGLAGSIYASNRAARTTPSPPPPGDAAPDPDIGVRERLHTVEFRLDEADEAGDIQDRRLDQIERHLDIDNPRWRHP